MSLDNPQSAELSSQPTIPAAQPPSSVALVKRGGCPMTRQDILITLSTRLTASFPPDVVDRTLSRISGTLAELDALPPYPDESEFQNLLSDQVYPFLAAAQSLAMESVSSEEVIELVNDVLG
jgi:hypothetical protein